MIYTQTKGDIMDIMLEESKQEETDQLNSQDRCDSCQAQAYVWVEGVNGDLLFCGHHFSKNEEKIRAYSFDIVDERHKLEVKRESSAAI
jgi:hypothetical protein